jgi:hypothetical protein
MQVWCLWSLKPQPSKVPSRSCSCSCSSSRRPGRRSKWCYQCYQSCFPPSSCPTNCLSRFLRWLVKCPLCCFWSGPVAKQCKCGVCGHWSHNHQKCPAVPAAAAAPVVEGQVGSPNDVTNVTKVAPPPPLVQPTADQDFYVDWWSVLYVVFDLETTGRSWQRDKIIELAVVVLDKGGVKIADASFSQFVKPRNPMPPFITELHCKQDSTVNHCLTV